MSNNAGNVSVGKPKVGGAIWVAPKGTQLPTNATAPLPAAYKCLGYANEDGVSNGVSTDTSEIKAWGGDTVYTARTGYSETFKYTLIESKNVDVLKSVYGDDNVVGDSLEDGIVVKHTGADLPKMVFVFEFVLSGGTLKRVVVEDGQVTEVGEVTYSDGDAIGYETTVAAYPGADGASSKEYIVTPAA